MMMPGATRESAHGGLYVMVDALGSDWKVIPVENLIAAFGSIGGAGVRLVMACGGMEEAGETLGSAAYNVSREGFN